MASWWSRRRCRHGAHEWTPKMVAVPGVVTRETVLTVYVVCERCGLHDVLAEWRVPVYLMREQRVVGS